MNNIVLVHGGFVDGSGWESVYQILKEDGYNVSIVQNPTISLEDDVAVTRRILAAQDGPAILVGHSYGGAVITEAGNDPKVAGLVYITAFAPDKGESVNSLIKDPAPGAPVPPILPPQEGYLFLDRAKFAASFAGDVNAETAAFMAESPPAHQFAVRWRHLQTCCGTPRGHTNARQVTIHPPRLCSSFPLSRRERGPGGEDRTCGGPQRLHCRDHGSLCVHAPGLCRRRPRPAGSGLHGAYPAGTRVLRFHAPRPPCS